MPPIPDEILSQLKDEMRRLEDEVFVTNKRIKELKALIGHATKLDINWSAKALHCLESSRDPLTTNEILDCIFYFDSDELSNLDRRKNYIKKLSLALNRLCNKGVAVGQSVPGYKGKIYFSSKWIAENGELKIEYSHRVAAKTKVLETKLYEKKVLLR